MMLFKTAATRLAALRRRSLRVFRHRRQLAAPTIRNDVTDRWLITAAQRLA